MSTSILRSHPNPKLRGWYFGPDVPIPNIPYRIMRRIFQITISLLCGVRVFNRHYEPTEGGVLYICNHQSFLDPMLMGFALSRPINYMARDTLFASPIFKWMITTVNAFPVKRNTADTGAIKEALRRIKAGGQVVIFAEGTRTPDGQIKPFLPGLALLSQRAAKWTIPVVIDGAYECWPRSQPLPGPGTIAVEFAPPISQETAKSMTSDELTASIRGQMIQMQSEMRRRAGRPAIKYE
jgi:1-acyl-sn-glycerol-3-phosphate acyltransferase